MDPLGCPRGPFPGLITASSGAALCFVNFLQSVVVPVALFFKRIWLHLSFSCFPFFFSASCFLLYMFAIRLRIGLIMMSLVTLCFSDASLNFSPWFASSPHFRSYAFWIPLKASAFSLSSVSTLSLVLLLIISMRYAICSHLLAFLRLIIDFRVHSL